MHPYIMVILISAALFASFIIWIVYEKQKNQKRLRRKIQRVYGQVPEPMMWMKLIGWSIGSFAVGMLVFKAKENQVMQKV